MAKIFLSLTLLAYYSASALYVAYFLAQRESFYRWGVWALGVGLAVARRQRGQRRGAQNQPREKRRIGRILAHPQPQEGFSLHQQGDHEEQGG